MTPSHVISQLLQSDTKHPKNSVLLQKVILTAYLGRLRVNGLPPDNKIYLGNYLFDEERIMFDYTRLNDSKKKEFLKWLQADTFREKNTYKTFSVNEYRGFTAEEPYTWWRKIKAWFQRRRSQYWKINDVGISLNYQLLGIEMCHGRHGSLIGFDQFLVPSSGSKYKNPNDDQPAPMGNTKRIFITNKLVDQLINSKRSNKDIAALCKKPHPQAVDILDVKARHRDMLAHRKMEVFVTRKSWYQRLWSWFLSSFDDHDESAETTESTESPVPITQLHLSDNINIYQRTATKEIIVTEKKPNIDKVVYCGGGAKIFGHVGFWKALNEKGISPGEFAGSSAGAIMSLLCNLGYSAKQIEEFFTSLKQEDLIYFDIDTKGFSDTHSLKTAFDFIISHKLKQIVDKYKIPYPEGKITFAVLDSIRQKCPGCGLREGFTVTSTRMKAGQTRYFSLSDSPDFEVSEAVKMSASFPIVFRSTLLDGEEHNDGGILSNFPTEAFSPNDSTFLESGEGNCLDLLAVQFDNGTERNTIDKIKDRVYREGFILNWLYKLITGVDDPASGWEHDRLKLRKYAAQSVVIDVGDVSASSFSVDEKSKQSMIDSGYNATMDYINSRYETCSDGKLQNKELMYSSFTSLGDLLAYCCYRGDKHWFETVHNILVQSDVPNRTALMKQSLELRSLYFSGSESSCEPSKNLATNQSATFFGHSINSQNKQVLNQLNHESLVALYPIILKCSTDLLKNKTDKKLYERARHKMSLARPFAFLDGFSMFTGEVHIILHCFTHLAKALKENYNEVSVSNLQHILDLFNNIQDSTQEQFYGVWDLNLRQVLRFIKTINESQEKGFELLKNYRRSSEPMQMIQTTGNGDSDDVDLSDGSNKGYWPSFGTGVC